MIVLWIAAVAAACTAPPFGISGTAVGCGRFDVLADYGTFDVRVRVAVTDGLSGMRLGVALSKPAECGNLADNKPNFVAGFASLDGTACYDRTVTGLRFCPVSVIPNITLLVEPFDLAYPAPLIYNVTFTRVGGCELPPTTALAPVPTLRQTSAQPTAPPTSPPRRFGMPTVMTSAASRLGPLGALLSLFFHVD